MASQLMKESKHLKDLIPGPGQWFQIEVNIYSNKKTFKVLQGDIKHRTISVYFHWPTKKSRVIHIIFKNNCHSVPIVKFMRKYVTSSIDSVTFSLVTELMLGSWIIKPRNRKELAAGSSKYYVMHDQIISLMFFY